MVSVSVEIWCQCCFGNSSNPSGCTLPPLANDQLVVQRHCSRDDNGDQLLSLYPVALTSFTLSVEEFLSFWGGSRKKYEGASLKAFELRQYSRPSERSPLLSLSQLFQRNWPYQLQWLPAPWGDALCLLYFYLAHLAILVSLVFKPSIPHSVTLSLPVTIEYSAKILQCHVLQCIVV